MCLGIPGQIIQVADSALQLAVVDVCGVKREVNISLICQDDPKLSSVNGYSCMWVSP